MKRVLLYAPGVLPPSQTFVAAQARALRRWRPVLVGRDLVAGGLDVSDLVPEAWAAAATAPRLGLDRAWHRVRRRVPGLAEVTAATAPDLIHAHFLTGGLDVLGTLRPPPCPVIVTAHGFDATWHGSLLRTGEPSQWVYGRQRARLLRTPVQLLAVSRFIRDELVHHGAPPERVHVHYTGVDTEWFTPARGPAPAGVVFVGRLVPKKGLGDLIEAIAILAQRGRTHPLRVVGDGPERKRLEQRAANARVPVAFLGSQPPEAVRAELRRAAVLCVPSRTDRSGDREGFGMVFAEAQAVGTPVVATRSGGIPEAVDEGRTGLLVDEGRPAALADALGRVLGDDGLRTALAAAARPWVLQHFDLARQTARLEDRYDEWASPSCSDAGRG